VYVAGSANPLELSLRSMKDWLWNNPILVGLEGGKTESMQRYKHLDAIMHAYPVTNVVGHSLGGSVVKRWFELNNKPEHAHYRARLYSAPRIADHEVDPRVTGFATHFDPVSAFDNASNFRFATPHSFQ
jgi:hypothetical protein